jgi:hypothetical protein
MRVTLLYPNGNTREILLAGVPRHGDHIRISNGPETPSLVVELVTWVEGSDTPPEPTVIVAVRPRI